MEATLNYFNSLSTTKTMVTYVWIDGSLQNLRCKTRTLDFIPTEPEDICDWNFDGSSTQQATGFNSDVFIKPRSMFRDPFTQGNNKLVLCDTYVYDEKSKKLEPHATNKRMSCLKTMEKCVNEHPWYGMEQEFVMMDIDSKTILGWPKNGYPAPQGPYYCGVGINKVKGREVLIAHYKACLYAGIKIAGSNAEVMLGQWEYQVGPCEGIDMGDHLWMSRYILMRVAEMFNVYIDLSPKPVMGDWNGTGCHTNFSTITMRHEGGLDAINDAIELLSKKHDDHMKLYDPSGGLENQKRLTGAHETCSYKEFKCGYANRGASVRIPRQTLIDNCGYFEDRRPAGNCDPYDVTDIIAKTTILKESY